jgi:SPX domain protein involved in polyphosphate accumulation
VEEQRAFLQAMELKGVRFKDPVLRQSAEYYQNWSNELYKGDKAKGIEYEPEENYVPHMFEDSEKVLAFMQQKYGTKFGDPSFTKDRSFESIKAAEAAGFKLKYTNPEQLFIARQHASDLAHTKVDTLREMEDAGLARRVKKGDKADIEESLWRSPNGELY